MLIHANEKTAVTVQNFPRCAGYLKAMRVKFDEPGLTDYWCAVLIADAFTDKELVSAGTVNFETMPGSKLLAAFEALFKAGRSKSSNQAPPADMESLKAFLGSRGVKVSKLPDNAAYWRVARILWPDRVPCIGKNMVDLVEIIRGMTKKQRQSAGANLKKVPAEWRA